MLQIQSKLVTIAYLIKLSNNNLFSIASSLFILLIFNVFHVLLLLIFDLSCSWTGECNSRSSFVHLLIWPFFQSSEMVSQDTFCFSQNYKIGWLFKNLHHFRENMKIQYIWKKVQKGHWLISLWFINMERFTNSLKKHCWINLSVHNMRLYKNNKFQ